MTAELVGKPEPQLFLTAIDRMGDGTTLVVGDRLDTDVAAAAAAGLDSALVLSGGTSRTQAEAAAAPPTPPPVEDGRRPRVARRRRAGLMAKKATTSTPRRRATASCSSRSPALDGVHKVATGRVKPRMGSGRPDRPHLQGPSDHSGLSITINTDGAISMPTW